MNNTWVAASAGTGKTKALIDRVLSLLLMGNKGILCLTFTNSAANEMLVRISRELNSWVLLTDDVLKIKLAQLANINGLAVLDYARSLFYKFHDLITISTIHSFCFSILTNFSTEASVRYNAKILEHKDELYSRAINIFLSDNYNLGEIAAELSVTQLAVVLEELSPIIAYSGEYHNYLRIMKEALTHPQINNNYEKIVTILRNGSKRDNKLASLLLIDPKKVFLDADGNKKKLSSIITTKLVDNFPQAVDLITNAQKDCFIQYQVEIRLRVIKRTQSILEIIAAINKIFDQLKGNNLTYHEVVDRSIKLLRDSRYHDLVMLSLSDKVQHILVDEAQDNSSEQWELIQLLTEDFFSGFGVNEQPRTIFIVGDVKQSIYSFQGAEPKLFQTMKQYFCGKARQFNQDFISRDLCRSYRSAPAILKIVDSVCNQRDIKNALLFNNNDEIKHIPQRENEVGHIEMWPVILAKDEVNLDDARLMLARKIANKIQYLITNDTDFTANDIMVLVRKRDVFIHYLITELEQKKIQAAGYDRFVISDHIFIQDLLALGHVLLDPNNDFKLCALLKSPLFGFTEEQLLELCYNRGEERVWYRLKQYQLEAFNKIIKWQSYIGSTFDIYYYITNEEKFGAAYCNLLEKFLEIAAEKPILSEFLAFVENNKIEVKNTNTDGVRIMTVHNAKGLEANVVFLADTANLPSSKSYITFNQEEIPFYLKQDNFDRLKERQQERTYQEYLRLLYVALTRAKNQLYITGCGKHKKGSWYDILELVITQDN